MNTVEFLSHLRRLNVRLWLDGERIRCKAPKGVLTPQVEQELADRKLEIVRLLRTAQVQDEIPPLTPSRRDGDLPLSFAQERLWFIDRLEPGSSAYNITAWRTVRGPLQKEVLERSLLELVKRQAVLRTRFPERGGSPVQVIEAATSVDLSVQDMSDVPKDRRLSEVRRLNKEESRRPFDLARGPLFRATLLVGGEEEHAVMIAMPHIICDAWSIGILLQDLARIYVAFAEGKPSPLPALPVQYSDYAQWQRTWLQGAELERMLSFWKGQIRGAPPVLSLPTDKPRPAVKTHEGSVKLFRLPLEVSSRLKDLSQQARTTSFVTLLAVYCTLLSRYSREDDFLIGTPIANRNRTELEGLVGLFANTLVLRANCSGDPTGRELLSRLHEMLLEVHAHQDFPFEKLVEAVRPDRSLSHSPLFQVTFVLQPPLSSEFEVTSGGAMFDLTLYMWDEPEGFRGAFEYNTDLFEESTIARFIENFQTLALGLVENPDTMISSLPAVNARERELLVREWNRTETDYPRSASVPDLFEAQAQATPEVVAVVSGGEELTYRELNQRANHLAHRLQKRGVTAGSRVGVCLDRSVDLVVSVLAVLKAGAIYVPLEPTYPKERLSFMIEDTQLSLLISQSLLLARLPKTSAAVLTLEEATTGEAPNLRRDRTSDDLAYVMYTSGSTGRPKGVCVRHRGIVRLVKNTNYMTFSPEEVFLQFAPISFDASTFELWGCLLNGGRLVIAPAGVLSVAELGRVVRENEVTTLWLTAGLFHEMVDAGLEDLASVRQLLAGGDVLSVRHVRKALTALGGCVLINGYGPTENTTFTCCYRMTSPDDATPSVPIGKAISNTKVYILDSSAQPVPLGAIGELYIGGDGLAQGYLNREELTAEKFVPDPFGGEDSRLYRSGDLVRHRADGNLEFVGRMDNQIKVRGFRVELGEIESVLNSHAEVQEAVVVARKSAATDKSLVAYVKQTNGQKFRESTLREFLGARLPAYMIPSTFVQVERFPLSSNGKVNRKLLPDPNSGSGVSCGDSPGHVSPRTSLEIQVAGIWKQVLGIPEVGVTDNFFELGGHSLLAVRMFSQFSKIFGRDLPLTALFRAPTIEMLAAVLSEKGWSPPWKSLVAIQPGGSKTPLFLIPGVGGNVLIFAYLANLLGPDQPLYGLQSRGLDGSEKPLTRIEEIASIYLEEVRQVQPEGPYLLGGACMGGAIAFEMAQQLVAAGEKVDLLALIETWSPSSLRLKRQKIHSFLHPLVFLFQGLTRHLLVLKRLRMREWLSYISKKLDIVKEMIHQKDVYRGERSILYQDVVSAANYEAMARYSPKNYPGYLHIILASDRPIDSASDSRLDWTQLAEGGYSAYHINSSDSGLLFTEPSVHDLSQKITHILNEVDSPAEPVHESES